MIKKLLKKLLPISMAIIILFTSTLMQVNKANHAYAMPAAIPAGAGVYALAVLAGAGVLYGLGKDGTADDLVKHAENVWDKTTSGFKDILNKSVTFVKGQTTLKEVKINLPLLTQSELDSVLNTATTVADSFNSTISIKQYESTAPEKDFDSGFSSKPIFKSKYADFTTIQKVYGTLWQAGFSDNSPYLFKVFKSSGVEYYKRLNLDAGAPGFIGMAFLSGSQVTINQNYGTSAVGVNCGGSYCYSYFDRNGIFPATIESILNVFNVGEFAGTLNVQVATYEDFISAKSNLTSSKVREQWETIKDAGLVIDGSAINIANPGLTFNPDGTVVDTTTGTNVNTGDISFPFPTITDGRLTIPVDSTGTVQDVVTGETTGTGEGTGEGTTPGTGEGLWDWLKSILQAILDALKALAALIGLTALIDLIKNGFDNINKKWDDARAAPKKKVDFSKLKVAAGTLTTVFPFSIPWDFARSISVLNASPQSPVFKVDVSKEVKIAGKKIPIAYKFDLDLGTFDAVAAVGRWAMILIFDISIILALRRLTPD